MNSLKELLFHFQTKGTATRKECWAALGWSVLIFILAGFIAAGIVEWGLGYDRTTALVYIICLWAIPVYYLLIKLLLLELRRCEHAGISAWWAAASILPTLATPAGVVIFLPFYMVIASLPEKKNEAD